MVAPATTKVRQTKVNIEWFFDKNRKTWRFLPNDLSHQVTYDRVDSVTKTPLTPARTHENKGWVPAVMALEMIPESRKSAPDVVKQRFAALFEDGKKEVA